MLGAPERDNPTVHGLKQAHAHRVTVSPLVAFGTLDEAGRPWATVWGGEAGFCRPVAGTENVLSVNSIVDARFDPVVRALFGAVYTSKSESDSQSDSASGASDPNAGSRRDEVVSPAAGKVMAGLSIDLETRDRLKLAGRFLAGSATKTIPGLANLHMTFSVEGALGNCPKYLNKKHIVPHVPSPELVQSGGNSRGIPLPKEAIELIKKADLFFIASKHGDGSMDVNHRGGPPGFMRVFRNQDSDNSESNNRDKEYEGGIVLVYPEYSGNRLYQSLGNMSTDPVAGLAIPDFETGNVLYVTGHTTIISPAKSEAEAAKYMPRGTKLAVRIDITEARFVRNGLPFRGSVIDYSPYNPPVRYLAVEKEGVEIGEKDGNGNAIAAATLLSRQNITPSISRYVFRVKPGDKGKRLRAWIPGQHVTFDFSPELDRGYSHMRDDDPQSLNDDFVRTFTVSAPLNPAALDDTDAYANAHVPHFLREDAEPNLEIIVRRHGPVTALLANWDLRVPLEIPILGFGGVENFRMPVPKPAGNNSSHEPGKNKKNIFVAAGVGITPLLAQATGLLSGAASEEETGEGIEVVGKGNSLKVLWSLRYEDLPLAAYAFTTIAGLGSTTKLFVTGIVPDSKEEEDILARVRELGAEVVQRRMTRIDLTGMGEKGKRKFFCCTGPTMMKSILQWIEGEDVVFESFDY